MGKASGQILSHLLFFIFIWFLRASQNYFLTSQIPALGSAITQLLVFQGFDGTMSKGGLQGAQYN